MFLVVTNDCAELTSQDAISCQKWSEMFLGESEIHLSDFLFQNHSFCQSFLALSIIGLCPFAKH